MERRDFMCRTSGFFDVLQTHVEFLRSRAEIERFRQIPTPVRISTERDAGTDFVSNLSESFRVCSSAITTKTPSHFDF